jgi:uncharacterized membrane protein YgcG
MYKKVLGLIAIVLAAVTIFSAQASAVDTQNFVIKSFVSDYYLSRDKKMHSQMQVKETIVADFPLTDQNHGILRAIPRTYNGNNLNLKINSVTDETGNAYNYTSKTENDNLILKIGDPISYVHGLKTYKIDYTLDRVVTFYGYDHDELYWNVNGDQWPQAMNLVQANVHIPNDIAANLLDKTACYTGAFGSTQSNCTIIKRNTNNETVINISSSNIISNETLTFVIGFKAGTFKQSFFESKTFQTIVNVWLAIIVPIIIAAFMLIRYIKFGRDPRGRGTIIPQYDRPKNVSLIEAATIYNEKLPKNAVSATIIDLAIRRYINIIETSKKKYKLVLLKSPDDLTDYEQQVVKMHFNDTTLTKPGSEVELDSLKYKLAKKYETLDDNINSDLTKKGYFRSNPSKVTSNYIIFAVVLSISGFFVLYYIHNLYVGVGLWVAGAIVAAFVKSLPARSQPGVEIHDYLLGMKMYMNMAEKDRIAYLQSPEGVRQFGDSTKPENTVHLYEKLLPFAIILGIEKKWSKQFENNYTDQQPDWYQGNYTAFNTVPLSSSISDFTNISGISFTAPGSGSGFSGGGGGGGGGGGW